jgi:hypothetical protein
MDIFYKCWNSSTSTWDEISIVCTESTNTSSTPFITSDSSSNLYLAWTDETDILGAGDDRDVFFKFYNKTSSKWSNTELVSTESNERCYHLSLATDDKGTVYFAWIDETDYLGAGTDSDLFYKYYNSTSMIWNQTEVLTPSSISSTLNPSLDVDSLGNVHIAWMDFYTEYGIYYKYWNTTTRIWSSDTLISSESTGLLSIAPILSIDTLDNIHVVWMDDSYLFGVSGGTSIFYKYWDSTINSWTPTQLVSGTGTAYSNYPSMDVEENGFIHVVWCDASSEGFTTILYRKLIEEPVVQEFSFSIPVMIVLAITSCLIIKKKRKQAY